MATKGNDPTDALVTVVKALEPLTEIDRQWVLQSAAARWTLGISTSAPNRGSTAPLNSVASARPVTVDMSNVRAFIRTKNPATDVQRVACLGYFIVQTTGQPGFSSKDINQAHTDSGGSKINMTRALDNATRKSKYLSNRGAREKQLTPLGEDVVAALPDQQAVKNVEAASKSRSGSRSGKRKKK